MVSSYTTRKRIEKQGVGENNNAWGGYLNLNTIDLFDECFGVVCVAMTTAGDSTLSTNNGLSDEGRRSQIFLTGAPTSNVRLFVPAVQSFYLVRNKMTGSNRVRLTNAGGTNGVDFSGTGSGAEQGLVVSDGTNVREITRTTSIGGFSAFTSAVLAAVSDSTPQDATGGAQADLLPFYDADQTGGPINKVPVSTFLNNVITSLGEETAVSVSDAFVMHDGTIPKVANLQNIFKAVNTLTEETTAPVSSTFLLSYETSVGAPRKISVQNATKFGNSGTKTGAYTVTTGDRNGSISYSGMSADATLTLPAAATFGIGNIFWFSHEDTGINPAYAVTFDGNGSETIDGQTTRKAWSGTRIGLMAISGGWKTICGSWVVITPQQSIAASSTASISHGQPGAPSKITGYFICTTTDAGYAVGDRVFYSGNQGASGSNKGVSFGASATDLFYTISTTTNNILNKSTGGAVGLTTASWGFVIVAEF